MNKVSIIIPAHDAANTVVKTVCGVLASTVPVDVWVVDDGSTDGTGALLDNLKQSYAYPLPSTITVIHQENMGAYMARLNALKQIKTPYFGFVDADDTIEPDMFGKMLAVAEREDCDVVQCGVDGVPDSELGSWYVALVAERFGSPVLRAPCFAEGDGANEKSGNCFVLPDRRAVEDAFVRPHLVEGQGSSFIWNKLYRNQYDFSTFVTFDRLTNYDDMIFNFQFFGKVRRMAFVGEKLYHHAATAGSATHAFGPRQFEDFRACAAFRRDRGIPSRRWLAVNEKSAVATVLRARMGLREKATWLARLATMAVEYGVGMVSRKERKGRKEGYDGSGGKDGEGKGDRPEADGSIRRDGSDNGGKWAVVR